jgi:ribonucleotide monophosphatase NagD (HAD superfamily)
MTLDSGAFLIGLERAAGREATVVGKPSPDFFRQAVELLGVPADRAAMVGDDLDADVLAAQAVGMRGFLVRTGKFRRELLEGSDAAPDHVIDSIADLPALLAQPV